MKSVTEKKLNIILISFFIILFIGTIGEAVAKTLYVDVNSRGGTCSDSTSYTTNDTTHPFCTIQKAADVVNPGDTVIVKNGIYTNTDSDNYVVLLTRGGTLDNAITFKAENKWGAIISGKSNTTLFGFGFASSSVNYINIQGFEMRETHSGAIWNNANANNILVNENLIHHTGRVYRASGNPGYGAITMMGSNITIDSNVIHTNGRLPNSPVFTTDKNQDHGIYLKTGNNFLVQNNIVYNHYAGWGVHYDGTVATNVKIINNTFSDPNPYFGGQVILWNRQTGTIIRNNIFNNPNRYALFCASASAGYVKVENNLASDGIEWIDPSCSNTSIFSLSRNIKGNPLFNDGTNVFTLQSISPAIDAGITTNAPANDFDGYLRDIHPDIGAYERNGIAQTNNSDTTPPAPPVTLMIQ